MYGERRTDEEQIPIAHFPPSACLRLIRPSAGVVRPELENLEPRLLLSTGTDDLAESKVLEVIESFTTEDFSVGIEQAVGGIQTALGAAFYLAGELPLIGE